MTYPQYRIHLGTSGPNPVTLAYTATHETEMLVQASPSGLQTGVVAGLQPQFSHLQEPESDGASEHGGLALQFHSSTSLLYDNKSDHQWNV